MTTHLSLRGGLPDDVAAVIETYVAHPAPTGWKRIRLAVSEVVAAAGPQDREVARRWMTVLSRMVKLLDERGMDLDDPRVWFSDAAIEHYIAARIAGGASTHSMSTRRGELRTIRQRALGVTGPPAPTQLTGAKGAPPYKDAEVHRLWWWADRLRAPGRRAGVLTLLALGLGAGLSAGEINHLGVSDVNDDGTGLVVTVPESRPRTIPVRSRWEPVLQQLVADTRQQHGAEAYLFRPAAARARNICTNFVQNLPKVPDPGLKVTRLRTTWLRALLTDGVRLDVIATAAGFDSLNALRHLMRDLPELDQAERARQLRGPE